MPDLIKSDCNRSAAVQYAQRNETQVSSGKGIAYFYCSVTDTVSQEPLNILGSIVVQLCEKYPMFWADIDDRYHRGKAKARYEPAKYELSELESLIGQFSSQLPGILLFLDALNESNKASAVLQSLSRIAGRNSSIRIMMTSTEELDADFGGLKVHRVPVMTANTDHDIFKYIVAYISHNQELSGLPAGLKEDIKWTLLQKSDGRCECLFWTAS